MSEINGKPKIIVSDADYMRLSGLAAGALERNRAVAETLHLEIERAEVIEADAMPADVVRMGSVVDFRSDSGPRRRVTLVFPGEADIATGRISILTPIGAALIGLSAGQSIEFKAHDGRPHVLTVVDVEQPARTVPARK